MKIWDLSIKKPVTVLMGLVCILLLGSISLYKLKLAFLPKVDFPFMFIQVIYPNQSPDHLEREVTRPLEEGLATIKGVKKVSSETTADEVRLFVEFSWGMTLDLIRLVLGLKVEEIKPKLPEGIRHIGIYSFNSEDIPVVQARISAPGIDLSENYDLLEKRIKQKVERIPGVAKVDLGGVLPKEVSIELKLDKINQHMVDVGQIITVLSQDNVTLSAGKIKTNGLVYNLRSQGKIKSLQEFENLRVSEGVLLKDVAEVLYEEPPIGYRRHLDGSKALALEVQKESTANTVEVATAVSDLLMGEIAEDPLLKGISLFVWQDQAEEITSSLNGLLKSGLYGALFAVLVLFFFLRRLSATVIVSVAIPISVIGAFIFLYAFGQTLNILTMMGLMLAVGMLVDNAVVVLESIYHKSLEGKTAVDATREGTREVVIALIAATTTTVIVFLSLVIADDNELGVWLASIGLTIAITLTISLIVSTTVIPLFTSKFLRRLKSGRKPKPLRIIGGYCRLLEGSMRHPWWAGLVLLCLVISIFLPASQLSKFKGTSHRNERMFIEYEFHDFFFLSDVEGVANQVEAFFETKREEWGIKSIYTWMVENEATTILTFKNRDMPFKRFKEIRHFIREGLPKIGGVSFVFDDNEDDSSQALAVQLFGPDTKTLKDTGEQIARLIADMPGLFDLRSGEPNNKKELQVSVDRDQANLYGVNPEIISQIFGFTLGGTNLPRFQNGDRETDVSLGLRLEDRSTIEDISGIVLENGVKLGSVAHFEFKERPSMIRRVDRKAHHRVTGTYEGDDYEAMQSEIEDRLNTYPFPAGVSWSWSDRVMKDSEEEMAMLLNLVLALILVYLVMASLFESLTQPLMILVTILFSAVGAFWFLFITRSEMDVMAMIGMMILIGIVVNNGIILMDRFNQLYRGGIPLEEALLRGAQERIRPILMTASTTVIGLVPMAIGNAGIGGGYYYPLARCVIGGLTVSTLLTLIGLPVIVILSRRSKLAVFRAVHWVKQKFSVRQAVPGS